jgi:Putative Ig domain
VKAIVLMLLLAVLLVGCGGGSMGSNPPPTPTGITVNCMSPVESGAMDQCRAVITPSGASQTATWAASGGAAISSGGILTAPTVTVKTNVMVTATAATVSGMFIVEVDPATPPPPSKLSYESPIVATVGTAITAIIPTFTGTATSFSVQPSLPTGLAIDPKSGIVSGTPLVSAAQATYTITATNAGGSTTFALLLTVNEASPAPPSGLSYPGPLQATVGIALTLAPTVNGTVTTYAVTPGLPSGLVLNTTTGVISGTPATPTPQATYVIKASNASGGTTFSLTITVSAPAPSDMVATSANSLTFDNQLVMTTSGAQPLAIINTGTNTLTISAVILAGGLTSPFTADSSGCTSLAAGGTCLVKVKFVPGGLGPLTDQMNISTSATAAPTQVLLSGNGVAASMTFDNAMVPVGQSAILTWNAPNATSCSASGSWSGSQSTEGTQTFTPTAPGYYQYVLNCPNPLDPMGTNSQSATLTAFGPTPTPLQGNPNDLGFEAAFLLSPPNQYVGLQTKITVPPLPPIPSDPRATLFLWPGLQPDPNSVNFLPIDNGVLQPVLTFGHSCAQTSQPTLFSS